MPNRPKDFSDTASSANSDDYLILDGLTAGTRKWLAAALTGVNSVTASTSTALTLTGGSTGASLVLGQGTTAGAATLTATGTGTVVAATAVATRTAFDISNTSTGPTKNGFRILGANASSADSRQWSFTANDFAYGDLSIRQSSAAATDPLSGTSALYISAARNLLIGTTTDAASLAGGLVINGSGAGAAASSTTTGALRVTGGVGVSGAGYFGGALTAPSLTGAASTDLAINGGSGTSNVVLTASGAGGNIYARPGASGYVRVDTGLGMRVEAGTLNVTTTTSASSSTVGALTIGNGTAATNVAVGGGNVNAGGTLTVGGAASVSGTSVTVINAANPAYNLWSNATPSKAGQVYLDTSGNSTKVGYYNGTSWNYGLTVLATSTSLTGGDTSITSTTASTGVGSGALQVAGGIYAGAASVFGGTVTCNNQVAISGAISPLLTTTNTSASSYATNRVANSAGDILDTGIAGRSAGGVLQGYAYAYAFTQNGYRILTNNGTVAATFDNAQAATFAGAVTANGQLIGKGTATNDNAATGYIGEYVEAAVAYGSAVAITTNTGANVTSISLTAGDWDIAGTVYYAQASGTTSTLITGSVSSSSGVIGAEDGGRVNHTGAVGNASEWTCATGPCRVSLSGTTTYYLVAYSSFTGSTSSAFGKIRARRVR